MLVAPAWPSSLPGPRPTGRPAGLRPEEWAGLGLVAEAEENTQKRPARCGHCQTLGSTPVRRLTASQRWYAIAAARRPGGPRSIRARPRRGHEQVRGQPSNDEPEGRLGIVINAVCHLSVGGVGILVDQHGVPGSTARSLGGIADRPLAARRCTLAEVRHASVIKPQPPAWRRLLVGRNWPGASRAPRWR